MSVSLFLVVLFLASRPFGQFVLAEDNIPAAMLDALNKRSAEIDQRENALSEREARLHLLEEDIRRMIREFEKLKEEIDRKEADRLSALKQEEEKRLVKLAKIYQSMPPKEAANRIAKLQETTILNLLRRIKEKNVAKILSNMSPAKAAKLSEKFVKPQK